MIVKCYHRSPVRAVTVGHTALTNYVSSPLFSLGFVPKRVWHRNVSQFLTVRPARAVQVMVHEPLHITKLRMENISERLGSSRWLISEASIRWSSATHNSAIHNSTIHNSIHSLALDALVAVVVIIGLAHIEASAVSESVPGTQLQDEHQQGGLPQEICLVVVLICASKWDEETQEGAFSRLCPEQEPWPPYA
jgi:hypothetical protein